MHSSDLPHDWLGPVPLKEIGPSHNDAVSPETPLWFRKKEDGNEIRYQVFFQQAVTSMRLLSILSAICNVHMTTEGIRMDWRQISQPQTPEDHDLLKMHTPLGEPWSAFLNVLPLFYQVVSEGKESSHTIKLFSKNNQRVLGYMRTKDTSSDPSNVFTPLNNGLFIEHKYAHLAEFIPETIGNDQLFSSLDSETNVQRDVYAFRMKHLTVLMREKFTHTEQTMAGLLEWKTDANGQRAIITETIPAEDQYIFTDAFRNHHLHSINSILGLLQLATLERGITEKFPREMPIKRGGKLQGMSEAQIPVLALMHKNVFAQGEAITKLEEKANNLRNKLVD